MNSMIKLTILIGVVLIVTVFPVVHRSGSAFAQPESLCEICVDPSTDDIRALREDCDADAQDSGFHVGILRPQTSRDAPKEVCPPGSGVFTLCGVSEQKWLCLGI